MILILTLFCTEYGAEDITILKDGLAFISTVCYLCLRMHSCKDVTVMAFSINGFLINIRRVLLIASEKVFFFCSNLCTISHITQVLHSVFSIQGLIYPGVPSFSDAPGKLYILDLLHPKPTPVELQIKGKLDLSSFNPHGISVYTDETGEVQTKKRN